MSDESIESSAPETPAEPTLAELSARIARRVALALDAATERVEQSMAGKSDFNNDAERRMATALVNQVGRHLAMLEKMPDPADKPPRIPPCPVCGVGVDQHWPEDCPEHEKERGGDFIWDYIHHKLLKRKDLKNAFPEMNSDDYAGAMIPRCGVCGKGPGAHWPDACPDNPIRDKMSLDRVVVPSEQRGYVPKTD